MNQSEWKTSPTVASTVGHQYALVNLPPTIGTPKRTLLRTIFVVMLMLVIMILITKIV
jgi:hypothetical protein